MDSQITDGNVNLEQIPNQPQEGENQHNGIPPTLDNLEQIRSILFGTQVEHFERRFQQLEGQIVQECLTMREASFNRILELEERMLAEMKSIQQLISSERLEREKSVSQLAQDVNANQQSLNHQFTQRHGELEGRLYELNNSHQGLDQRLNHLSEEWEAQVQQMRTRLGDESQLIHKKLHEQADQFFSALEREVNGLKSHNSSSQTRLSNLFQDLAARIQEQ